MTATLRGRLARLGVAAIAVAGLVVIAGQAAGSAGEPLTIEVTIHYSHFVPAAVTVPAGQPVRFVIHNADPIDHEWIVGDAAVHERHRTGTEPSHAARPTEVSIDARATVTTIVTFEAPGTPTYVCHLPGHEAYGMVGTVTISVG